MSAIGLLPLAIVVAAAAAEEHREPRDHHDGGRERRRDRADQDVAVLHVRQLVSEHAVELVVVEHRRMPSVAATAACSGSRPVANAFGDVLRDDVAARLRQVRALGEPADDLVEAMPGPDLLRAVHAEDDLVREPVRREVRHDREQEADDHSLSAAERLADDKKAARSAGRAAAWSSQRWT